jgi:uroporphyrinogen decarboxylase
MGVDFDILEKEGPRMQPRRSMADAESIRLMDPARATPFVAEALRTLRKEVGGSAAVLGFVGLPYTLATYLVEGGSSSEYKQTKMLAYQRPQVLHCMLERLAENIGNYALFQIESGAQVIQLFDSWAGALSPADYDEFAAPYQRRVVEIIKRSRPDVPLILYINRSGALLERMAASGVDIVSLDWTVTLEEARRRMGEQVGVQGNLDPMLLFAPDEVLRQRTEAVLRSGGGRRHVMNLGHGIDAGTSEDKAQLFVDTVRNFKFPQA